MKTHQQSKSAKSTQVHQAYEIYLNSLAISGRKSVISLLRQACNILGWESAPAYYPWHTLSYQKLHQVRSRMIEFEYSMNSVNLTLSALRGIAKTAFNLEMLDGEQLMRIQAVPVVRGELLRKGRSLSEGDIKALLKACTSGKSRAMALRDRAILLLGCGAGIRCNELILIKVNDFDVVTGSINIMNGKGRKQRSIALSEPVVKAVTAWIQVLPSRDGALFREIRRGGSIRGNGLSKQGVAKILSRIQHESGVSPFTIHDMRRTFVTRLIETGCDINTVKTLCNHASIQTTARYDLRPLDRLKKASRRVF